MFKNKFIKTDKAAKKQAQPVSKQDYFNNCHRTYSCIHCRAHLANHDELISKLFQGNHGRAYLFNKVVNIGCKQAVQRELLTGLHAVADIYCDSCETTLGWKYEQAFVPSQKYKEGKYIIELVHMLKENDWDLTSYNARELLQEGNSVKGSNLINCYKVGDNYIGPISNRYNLLEIGKQEGDKSHRNDNNIITNSISNLREIRRDEMFTFEMRREMIATTNVAENNNQSQIIEIKSSPPNLGSQNGTSEKVDSIVIEGAQRNNEDTDDNGRLMNQENIELLERTSNNGAQMRSITTASDNLNLLSASSKNSLGSSRSQSDVSSYVSITDGSSCGGVEEDPPYELCQMSQNSIHKTGVEDRHSSSLSPTPSSTEKDNAKKNSISHPTSTTRANVSCGLANNLNSSTFSTSAL